MSLSWGEKRWPRRWIVQTSERSDQTVQVTLCMTHGPGTFQRTVAGFAGCNRYQTVSSCNEDSQDWHGAVIELIDYVTKCMARRIWTNHHLRAMLWIKYIYRFRGTTPSFLARFIPKLSINVTLDKICDKITFDIFMSRNKLFRVFGSSAFSRWWNEVSQDSWIKVCFVFAFWKCAHPNVRRLLFVAVGEHESGSESTFCLFNGWFKRTLYAYLQQEGANGVCETSFSCWLNSCGLVKCFWTKCVVEPL